jgi:hypothetical protein
MRNAATLPGLPRVTDALPCSVATCPISPVDWSAPASAGGFCARAAKPFYVEGVPSTPTPTLTVIVSTAG